MTSTDRVSTVQGTDRQFVCNLVQWTLWYGVYYMHVQSTHILTIYCSQSYDNRDNVVENKQPSQSTIEPWSYEGMGDSTEKFKVLDLGELLLSNPQIISIF